MIKYKLIDTRPISKDIISLRFSPLHTAHVLRYQAGQYINTILQKRLLVTDAVLSLSLANAYNQNHELEFHLRHDEKQKAALSFIDQLQHNPVIDIIGPFGQMTRTNLRSDKKLLLLAGGTGIAPFKALLEEMIEHPDKLRNQSISLWWGVRKPEDLYLLDFLEKTQAQYPTFTYKIILSTPDKPNDWHFANGWLHDMLMNESEWSDIENTQVYASGPFEMVKKCQSTLLERGLDKICILSDMLV
ncbi:MAG: FAD-binding oxidoreductase [Candidatus Berkiella sp.]